MRFKLKAIKIQGKLLKFLQTVLLFAVLGVLTWQLSAFDWSNYQWSWPENRLALCIALLLVIANWFFEWRKWTHIAQRIGLTDTETVRSGFYAGMVTGFLTPSALGNFLGRMALVRKSFKARVVSFTFFANGAQFIISLLFGSISLLLFNDYPFEFRNVNINAILFGLMGVCLIGYFFIHRFPFLKAWLSTKAPSVAEVNMKDKLLFLIYSIFRYLVFSFQFYLVLIAFQPELSISMWFWVWYIYLWTTLSPSLVMGKLFIRESVAVFVLTHVGVELPVALLVSLLVWTMNNALPSLFAYFKWKRNVVAQA